ncbi:DMT family transporter [Pseudooceanicola sp. C21-150M6]|uniref:DMT family transporter n=1 Tax=Pseudooceanicola sp. C21-150M6 TaxID=3434355 RepID=UPI003D7F2A7C
MLGAVFCFTSMDALAKAISLRSSPVMALWARYAGQGIIVLILVAPRLRTVARSNFPGLQLVRSVLLLCATGCFFVGLGYLEIAEATAIMDINPMIITLGAAVFLGEKLGPRRIIAIVIAMIGAMIVIRPGSGVMSWAALFPLGSAIFYSTFSLITRHVGNREDPWTSLLYGALFGSIVMTGIVLVSWQTPDLTTMVLMAAIACVGTLAQLLFIRAFTAGEAAMLAPFGYVGLIFATFWGYSAFGEVPDIWTVTGAVVIVASGVYVWHRETRAAPLVAETKGSEPR